MSIEERIKEFSMCLWKNVAEKDKNKCLYKTLSADKPCHICTGYEIYCSNYFANGNTNEQK